MQSTSVKYIVTIVLALLCCAGCHRSTAKPPAPLPVEQLAPVLEQTFANAAQEIKNEAGQYVKAVQSNDWPGAFALLRQLRAHPELTPEQRAALVRVQQTTVQKLNDAAAQGNENAAAAMSDYKASK